MPGASRSTGRPERHVGQRDPRAQQERGTVQALGEMPPAIVEDRPRVRRAGGEAEARTKATQRPPAEQRRERRRKQAGPEVADHDEREPEGHGGPGPDPVGDRAAREHRDRRAGEERRRDRARVGRRQAELGPDDPEHGTLDRVVRGDGNRDRADQQECPAARRGWHPGNCSVPAGQRSRGCAPAVAAGGAGRGGAGGGRRWLMPRWRPAPIRPGTRSAVRTCRAGQ